MKPASTRKPATPPSRAALQAVRRKLEAEDRGVSGRLALAEACFRIAVLPDTDGEEAIELMRQAAAYDPYHPKMLFHLGRLLHQNGDPQGAVFEYRRALRLSPWSHRIYVHLALALNDLKQPLGMEILEALQTGNDSRLEKVAKDLDKFIAGLSGDEPKDDDSKDDDAPSASPSKKHPPSSGGRSRWVGLWKLSLLGELSRAKPGAKVAGQRLDEGKRLIEGDLGVGDYAVASLFFVLDGPRNCRQVEGWLRDPALAKRLDRPALKLVRSICELGASANAGEFVGAASAKLLAGELPPELVCILHYSWHGPSSNADVLAAAALLDRYPEAMRSMACFRELRLAILDHYARLAWGGERLDRAEILWRETIGLDPCRVPVAHNLALAATRARATEKYEPAWERAAETRYLLAASAGDVRVELEDRIRFHQSFAQQSLRRYVPEDARRKSAPPTQDQLRAWLKDPDALQVWLRDGELLYLNSRLRFHSAVHFLGIDRDCSEEDADAAKDCLLRQFALCFRGREWAGSKTFLALVEEMAQKACAQAKDTVSRNRDPYYEAEQEEARKLAQETLSRGLTMYQMIKLAAASSAGADIKRQGLEVARFLLSMPWRVLEPVSKRIGLISQDTELLAVFLSYVSSLVLEKGQTKGAESKIEAVEDCIRAVPDAMELRLVLCRLLLDARRHRQAYDTAMEAWPLLARMTDRKEAAVLEKQFAICVDNAAMAQIPQDLLSPTRERVPDMIRESHRVLAEFPRAGGLRLLMAKYLIQTAGEDRAKLSEASKLLESGLDLLLTAEQLAEARKLLDKAGSRSESADSVKQIRELLESAAEAARKAVASLRDGRTPAKVRAAMEGIESALQLAAQAEEIASAAGLPAAAESARQTAAGLREILQGLGRDRS